MFARDHYYINTDTEEGPIQEIKQAREGKRRRERSREGVIKEEESVCVCVCRS